MTGTLLIAEIPYPVRPKSPVAGGNRECVWCVESVGRVQKADFTCIDGDQYMPLCFVHAEEWARKHGLWVPALDRRWGARSDISETIAR